MLSLVEDPSANHIREMALYFDAHLEEGNDASTITMDNGKATGFISSYRLFSGLNVWVYNITFRSDFIVRLEMSEVGPIYFSYNVNGHFLHRFLNEDRFSTIVPNQHMIVRGSHKTGVEIVFPKDMKLEIAVILIDDKLLGNQEIRNAKRIYGNIQGIFDHISVGKSYRHLGSIETRTREHASIVCKNNDTDLISCLATEGAVLNMLASQLSTYQGDVSISLPTSGLNKSELSSLMSLGDYVMEHLDERITLSILSRYFGLSFKKLQSGIRYLYGDSVAHYITNIRIGYAKHLLGKTDLNVSEVCYRIGISSRSHFSKCFRERYGITPSHYRKSA